MKIRIALAGLALLALSACSPEASYSDTKVDTYNYTDAEATGSGAPQMANAVDNAEGGAAIPEATLPQLAYVYQYSFQASHKGIEALSAADQAACEKAGPSQCQMISFETQNSTDDRWASRSLELRVSPQWLKTWKNDLPGALKTNSARITSETVSSEDLSLRIVDTEAHIKNREALRDRLQTIIRTHSGKVSELVEAEAKLSQVQQEIDAARSALAVMQKRVATIKLNLSYTTAEAAASKSAFDPVVVALKGSLRAFMEVVGMLIFMFAYLLPLAIIGIPAFLFGRKWLRQRRAK